MGRPSIVFRYGSREGANICTICRVGRALDIDYIARELLSDTPLLARIGDINLDNIFLALEVSEVHGILSG